MRGYTVHRMYFLQGLGLKILDFKTTELFKDEEAFFITIPAN
jgi:hypothetical protein